MKNGVRFDWKSYILLDTNETVKKICYIRKKCVEDENNELSLKFRHVCPNMFIFKIGFTSNKR